MIRDLAAVWWALCAWTGLYVLGCALFVGAVLAFGFAMRRWQAWRTPKCRYCFVPLFRAYGGRVGVSNLPRLCDECFAAWLTRWRRLPREVQG